MPKNPPKLVDRQASRKIQQAKRYAEKVAREKAQSEKERQRSAPYQLPNRPPPRLQAPAIGPIRTGQQAPQPFRPDEDAIQRERLSSQLYPIIEYLRVTYTLWSMCFSRIFILFLFK